MTLNFQIKPLTEQEYCDAPEAVRRVYIHVLEKIPMDLKQIKATIKAHPEYFTLKSAEKPKTHSQKLKRFFTLKEDLRSKQKKLTAESQRAQSEIKGQSTDGIWVEGTIKPPSPGEIRIEGEVTNPETVAQVKKLHESLIEEEGTEEPPTETAN